MFEKLINFLLTYQKCRFKSGDESKQFSETALLRLS